ncbi:PQQ-like beta-propeller repeat protein [Ktedonobacter racemifer]|uniref:Pyrrolo-quinoline quinone n=1 Tax=Ktedonobacter racemifer DSM 44963 TaxID=485913 RepID=D6U073_KTERA|nr:PQQ-binding-like beta-propeller repeat protein [Ktedonobacter racemifer]EFH82213.1 Pyrrolo-quinoline quinone [Ktedonobacter racemifer DSM 44963]
MSHEDTSFIPEHLDQQIEHPAASLAPIDQRLVQELRQEYQADAHANAQSLQRAWERLESIKRERALQDHVRAASQPLSIQEIQQRKRNMKKDLKQETEISPRSSIKRTMSLLVAVLVVAIIVGSAAFVFSMAGKKNAAHTSSNTAGQVKATATPVVNSSGIYITYLADWSTTVISKLDSHTHTPLWSYKSPGTTVNPAVYGNTVYASAMNDTTNQPQLMALDAMTGKIRWEAVLKSVLSSNAPSSPANMGYLTTPVIVDGQVYVFNRAGTVFAFDANTGKQLWTYKSGATALVDGTIYPSGAPVVSNGVLYGALERTYFAVDAKTGKQIWSSTIGAQEQVLNGVQVTDDSVYASSAAVSQHHGGMSLQSYVYAFNAKDGQQRWKFSTQNWVNVAPVVADGHIYFFERNPFASHSTLHALDAQGHEVWHNDYDTDLYAPIAGGGYVSFSRGTYDHTNGKVLSYTLYVLDAATGKTSWKKDVVADPSSINEGVLYTQGANRQLIAYDLKDAKELWHGQYGVDLVDKMGSHSASVQLITVIP